jgi:hypothetical protein
LNKGFDKETLQKILNVKQELLSLNQLFRHREDSVEQSEGVSFLLKNLSLCQTLFLGYLKSIEIK